jgi:hypothetical protein
MPSINIFPKEAERYINQSRKEFAIVVSLGLLPLTKKLEEKKLEIEITHQTEELLDNFKQQINLCLNLTPRPRANPKKFYDQINYCINTTKVLWKEFKKYKKALPKNEYALNQILTFLTAELEITQRSFNEIIKKIRASDEDWQYLMDKRQNIISLAEVEQVLIDAIDTEIIKRLSKEYISKTKHL